MSSGALDAPPLRPPVGDLATAVLKARKAAPEDVPFALVPERRRLDSQLATATVPDPGLIRVCQNWRTRTCPEA